MAFLLVDLSPQPFPYSIISPASFALTEKNHFEENEDSSKKALKAEVKSAYSRREHMATGNGEVKGQKRQDKPPGKKQTTEPQLAYVGKPLTQEEINEKRRQDKNASGYTPLEGIIPASHWQELERSEGKAPQGYSTHYNNCTKNAPVFINALVEQFSLLLGDDPENTPQNINRAAGSDSFEQDGSLSIVAMEKEAQAGLMHHHRLGKR